MPTSFSFNLVVQRRLRLLAETHHRLHVVQPPRLKTDVQKACHARLCEGLHIAWLNYLNDWPGFRPSA